MAATGYTPIQLYYSTTASAVPTSGNLLSGELAINIADGKLYYKNSGGTVKPIAATTTGTNAQLLANDGSGGFSNVTIGSGLSYSGGTLSSTDAGGTVTTVSVVSANGLAGTVANATTTPAITLSTSITGVLKGNGTAISAAVAGTDYVTPTGTETLTNKTLTNPTVTNYTETRFTANSSTAITLDLANGTMQDITLTGTATITMPTAVAGKSFILLLRSGAGSYSVTWTTVKWPGGTAPTVTTTASRLDIYSFFSDGTNWYGITVSQNYTP